MKQDGQCNHHICHHDLEYVHKKSRKAQPITRIYFQVVYLPLVISCVLPRVAVLTPFVAFFPPLMAEDSPGQLPPEQRLMLDQIVATISALLDQFSLKDQLFSLGKFAYTVADDLEQLPVTSQRRSLLHSEAKKVGSTQLSDTTSQRRMGESGSIRSFSETHVP